MNWTPDAIAGVSIAGSIAFFIMCIGVGIVIRVCRGEPMMRMGVDDDD